MIVFLVWIMTYSMSLSRLVSSKPLQSVAVIGGGFAGLGASAELAASCKQLNIYDICNVGEAGASSAAGGLLHPFAPRGNLVWNGDLGFDATIRSLEKVSELSSAKILYRNNVPFVRPVYKAEDLTSWSEASLKYPDYVSPLERQQYLSLLGIDNQADQSKLLGAFLLHHSAVIHAKDYLQALWKYVQAQCQQATWHQLLQTDLTHLSSMHDIVIITAGAGSTYFFDDSLRVKLVKGRNIHYDSSNSEHKHPPISNPILSGEYIVPRSGGSLICGATHEHVKFDDHQSLVAELQNTHDDSDLIASTQALLQDRISNLHSSIAQRQPTSVSGGIRLVTERSAIGRLPIVGRHPGYKNVWVLTGLGSRGLIYHALGAQYLREAILADDENLIPSGLWPSSHMKKSKLHG